MWRAWLFFLFLDLTLRQILRHPHLSNSSSCIRSSSISDISGLSGFMLQRSHIFFHYFLKNTKNSAWVPVLSQHSNLITWLTNQNNVPVYLHTTKYNKITTYHMWKNKLLNPCLKMNSLFGFNTNFISTVMMNSLICIWGGGGY